MSTIPFGPAVYYLRESPLAPWPGYLIGEYIITPDVRRLVRDIGLIMCEGSGIVRRLERASGPVREAV